MMNRLFATLLLTAASVGANAQGFSIAGSFSGIAEAEVLPLGTPPPRPESYYDGALVTGSFELIVPGAQFQTGGSDYAYFTNPGGLLALNYTIRDESFSFVGTVDSGTGGVILLTGPYPGSEYQVATFLTTFMPKYDGATLRLSGAPGSLFDGLDATTLHLPPSPPSLSTYFVSSTAGMLVEMSLTDVQFGNVTPVPEPATAAMFASGLVVLFGWGALRRRRVSRVERRSDR